MNKRLLILVLFVAALVLGGLGFGYSYLDAKEFSGTVQDNAGKPVSGATVAVADRSTISDSQGRFLLPLPHQSFVLTVSADGFAPVQENIDAPEFLVKHLSTELSLSPNVYTLTVTTGDTHRPVAGATVQLMPAGVTEGPPSLIVITDAQGRAAVHGIKTGTRLDVTATGYISGSVTYGPQASNALALAPAVIKVKVVDAYSQAPLSGVDLSVGAKSSQTDAQGEAELYGLTPGMVISAKARGHEASKLPYDGNGVLTVALRPTALDGVVLDAVTEKPIVGARLIYDGAIVVTGAGGAYHLDDIPAQLQLAVKAPGYRLTTFTIKQTARFDLSLTPFKAKGLHIYYGMPRDDVLSLLNRVQGTAVNAVVLDVKEGAGDLLWPSHVPLAVQIGAPHTYGIPPSELVDLCRARHWYCIARMVVFKDSRLAEARPDLALHTLGGALLNDGTAFWVNPAKTEIWQYDIALAKELSAMGFDEVQLDYIRFPGRPMPLEYGTADTRVATIKSFLQTFSNAFSGQPAYLSADVFGLTTAAHDESGIGQLLEVDAPYLDYVSPMMYPSTWTGSPNLFQAGLGIPTCSSSLVCPYDIIYKGSLIAHDRTKGLVRPWLQAYGDYGFGLLQYIQQRQGADDANSAGWLFWNNQGLYDVSMFGK